MSEQRVDPVLRIAAIAALVIGCVLVLQPFLTAALSAAVLCSATWPVFVAVRRVVRGNDTAAAAVMTGGLVVLVLVPFAWLASTVADNVPALVNLAQEALDRDMSEAPAWITDLPLIGTWAGDYWHRLAESQEELVALGRRVLEPAQAILVQVGLILGQGIAQLALAFFIGFFLYRDGEALVRGLRLALGRVAGDIADELLGIIHGTVQGVILGIVGTAAAQGSIAALGFAIAGVPGAVVLGLATAGLSLIPVGPPLIWMSATAWLFSNGHLGWAIFMAIWGMFGISGIDNIVKPLLISRGASLPFVLVLLGVLGGVLAFGFAGVFIGPTLLAVGVAMLRHWTGFQQKASAEPPPAAPAEPPAVSA